MIGFDGWFRVFRAVYSKLLSLLRPIGCRFLTILVITAKVTNANSISEDLFWSTLDIREIQHLCLAPDWEVDYREQNSGLSSV